MAALAMIVVAVVGPFVAGPFRVDFASNASAVSDQAAATLDNAAAAWRVRRSDRILLSARSDRLARRRAESVQTYLMNRGVPATAIVVERTKGAPARSVVIRFALGAIAGDRR